MIIEVPSTRSDIHTLWIMAYLAEKDNVRSEQWHETTKLKIHSERVLQRQHFFI